MGSRKVEGNRQRAVVGKPRLRVPSLGLRKRARRAEAKADASRSRSRKRHPEGTWNDSTEAESIRGWPFTRAYHLPPSNCLLPAIYPYVPGHNNVEWDPLVRTRRSLGR